jgi:hypothetical protein
MQTPNLYRFWYLPRNVSQTRTGEEMMPTIGYKPSNRLSADEIEVRVWAFVIVVLVSILLASMGMFLYSVSFVQQPMNGSMAAIDKVYTQQISTIMVFITGVLGGVAGRSGVKAIANASAKAEAIDNDEPPKP